VGLLNFSFLFEEGGAPSAAFLDWKLQLGAAPFDRAKRKGAVLDGSFLELTLAGAVRDSASLFHFCI
jgi:hypothetical protein